jgi:hypothetical protein
MSTQITNTFTTFELSDKEALQSAIFTTLQLQNLQNQLANAAESRLALEFDANNPSDFLQQEAFLKGQIELLKFLIDGSAMATEELTNPELPTE